MPNTRTSSSNPLVDLVSLGSALTSAFVTYHVARALFEPAPEGIVHVEKGYSKWSFKGFWLRAFIPIEAEESMAAQTRWVLEAMAEHGPEKGSVITYELLKGRWRIQITNPIDIHHVLVKNAANYPKGADPYESLELVVGKNSILALRDEAAHTLQRKAVNRAFSPVVLNEIAHNCILKRIEWLMQKLGDRCGSAQADEINLTPYFDQLTLDVVAEAAFKQLDIKGTNISDEFRGMISNMGMSVILWMPYGQVIPTPIRQRLTKHITNLRRAAAIMVKNVQEERKEEEEAERKEEAESKKGLQASKAKVLVDYLVQEEVLLKDDAIIDQAFTFLFAGHETTSKGLIWTAYLLAAHPEEQAHLFEEVSGLFGLNTIPSLADVRTLPYLSHVINESLRLCSPVPIVFRVAAEADMLPYSKRIVPRGHAIGISPGIVHHLPHLWGPDVEDFKPARWDKHSGPKGEGGEEGEVLADKLKRMGCMFFPFLEGKRNCIGKEFALIELLLTIAILVRRFELKLPDEWYGPGKKVPRRTQTLTMRPKEPIPFILVKRRE